MSYLVLARKYRPRTFAQMVGQEHVVQALSNALQQQRLHHAYLFTGTRGVGKTTVSRILAKSLNCQGADGQGGITSEPCGVCSACTDIDSGRFVDYTELDAASNRGVDEVQSLLEQAVYKPVQGRFKVFMIDEVHMLTGHAFNAMLKTLEEPPEYLKFVLATTDPQKVPVTVLSRCLQFNLRPMAPETVQEHLAHVLGAENVPADPPALRQLARAARGSMRDALSLTDQAIAFGGGRIEDAQVRQMLGSVDRSHVFRLIDALAQGDGKTVVETSDELRLHGLSAAAALEDMSMVLQRMAVHQAVPSEPDASDEEAVTIAALAQRMPADETQLLYSICLHGRAELGLAPDEYAGLTMVLLRLLAFKPAAGVSQEKKTLIEPHRPVAAPVRPPAAAVMAKPASAPPGRVLPVVEPRQAPPRPMTAQPTRPGGSDVVGVPVRVQPEPLREAAPAAAAPVVATEDGDFWQATVQDLVAREAVTALVRELALQAQLVARDVGHWMLRVERESLNQPASRERLRAALHAAGHVVDLSVEVGPIQDSPARRQAQVAREKQAAAEQIILNDPFVQQMVRDFGAKIVPGSIKPVEKH
ncbi:DNA polymerase III subunit gamma/tau [Caenimonas sedimenti]|uniref:DNA polymerase III subunit gamma/tau n=1 Tax=Caenimonas sedimenti TaxID=2596921 RepID=A0A562ZUA3_9BURK|nr:DNA polymerase III subunit gamma/tau [Caenimonas sedimenti]TWO71961.1 DNA polymerase III subunit gamma/tau [Caenimonas sedimenti]